MTKMHIGLNYSTRYSGHILMKFGFSRQMTDFRKILKHQVA